MGRNRSPAIIILVLLDMTPELLMNTMLITITSVLLRPATKGITLDLNVRTKRSKSATSIPMRTLARSPRQMGRRLSTPSSLRSAKRSSTLFVTRLTSSITTVSMWLVMRAMLLLDLLDIMKNMLVQVMDMGMDIMEPIRFKLDKFCKEFYLTKINISLQKKNFPKKKKKKKKKK